jgi:hypothetical protein
VSLVPLHEALIAELAGRLIAWRFVKARRSFTKSRPDCHWHLHLAFVNHAHDFDVIVDVAVEHMRGRKRLCIVGAELGNIRGTGQHRWGINSIDDVPRAASGIMEFFGSTGLPFLERYSNVAEILKVFRTNPREARLIGPLASDPVAKAALIEERACRDA